MLEINKYYHLYNRGHNKQKIFFEEKNYSFFLEKLKEYVSDHISLIAYCLMPNHFHLFVRIEDEHALQCLKNFLSSYSKSINKRFNRVGALFQGPLKQKEIDSEHYYTRIITYIHQNPLASGLCKDLKEYKYSSYNAILSEKPTLIKRFEVLQWFGGREGFLADHISLHKSDLSGFENLTGL